MYLKLALKIILTEHYFWTKTQFRQERINQENHKTYNFLFDKARHKSGK